MLKPALRNSPDPLAIADNLEEADAIAGTLLSDPRLQKISFTGSTKVRSTLRAQPARRIVKTSMELGGNASFIVTDAYIDAAVEGPLTAKLRKGSGIREPRNPVLQC